jgi:hypothetical protein
MVCDIIGKALIYLFN